LIKVEFKFAADRWWVAVEIGSDTATEISDVLVGPVELGVDVVELLAQWVTSSVAIGQSPSRRWRGWPLPPVLVLSGAGATPPPSQA
jgi:hypothetical protein